MNSHHIRMLLGCLLVLGAVLLLPRFGYGAAGGSLAFGLLMLVCCVGPMLLMLFGGRKQEDETGNDETPRDGEGAEKSSRKTPRSGGSCH